MSSARVALVKAWGSKRKEELAAERGKGRGEGKEKPLPPSLPFSSRIAKKNHDIPSVLTGDNTPHLCPASPPPGAAQRKKIFAKGVKQRTEPLQLYSSIRWLNAQSTSILKPPPSPDNQNHSGPKPSPLPSCPCCVPAPHPIATPTTTQAPTTLPRWLPPQPLRPPPTSLTPPIVFGDHTRA